MDAGQMLAQRVGGPLPEPDYLPDCTLALGPPIDSWPPWSLSIAILVDALRPNIPMITLSNSLTDDLRDQPAYGLAKASRYLKLEVAAATLRSWLVGWKYPKGDGTRHWQPLSNRTDKHP